MALTRTIHGPPAQSQRPVGTWKWLKLGAALAIFALAAACSDNTVQGHVVYSDAGDTGNFAFDSKGSDVKNDGSAVKTDGSAQPQDGAAGTDEPDAAAANLLQFAHDQDDFGGLCDSMCALKINQNSTRKIGVRYTQKGGLPAEPVIVEFVLLDPANQAIEILTPNVFTDEKGEAWAEIKSALPVDKASILARVIDDPDAGQLQFDVSVVSKAKGPMTIRLHYKGAQLPTEFGVLQARLSKQVAGEPACAKLDLGGPLPTAAWTSPTMKWDTPWALNFTSLPNWVAKEAGPDGTVAFTVVGLAFPSAGSSASKATAAGCVDTGAVVKIGSNGVVEGEDVIVDIKDLPPRLKGTYDVVNHIDLLSVLPDGVEMVFKTILDVVSDPVAGLLSLACKLGGGSLDSLCGYVFTDKANPSIKEMTAIGDIVTKFLNAILLSYLPDSVKTGLSTGADLGEILTNLEMGGTIEIKAEPDNTGFLPASQTKQLWSTVTYKWTLGQTCAANDPNCGKKTFNIEAFQSEAIVGQFDLWRDAILSQVKIGKHSLKVKWGALINYIVQKQLLPAMTKDPKNPNAPVIDSYAKLLKSLMGGKQCLVKDTCCNDFAKQLAAKQSLMNETFLTSTCEVLVNVGTGFLEAQLNKLDGDTGDPTKNSGLLLSSTGCNIYETNQDMLIDLFGGAQPKDQCTWDMTLTIGGSPQAIKGKFFAQRQQ